MGNGWHLCTPVLMNMCNITFQVLKLSTFVFNKCSEIVIFTIIFRTGQRPVLLSLFCLSLCPI